MDDVMYHMKQINKTNSNIKPIEYKYIDANSVHQFNIPWITFLELLSRKWIISEKRDPQPLIDINTKSEIILKINNTSVTQTYAPINVSQKNNVLSTNTKLFIDIYTIPDKNGRPSAYTITDDGKSHILYNEMISKLDKIIMNFSITSTSSNRIEKFLIYSCKKNEDRNVFYEVVLIIILLLIIYLGYSIFVYKDYQYRQKLE
jgi:hypothetical protein